MFSSVWSSSASPTITDSNATAPDGTGDATTVTSGSTNWAIDQNVTALPVGTYTAAISVKSLSGSSQSFKFGLSSSMSLQTATTSWQRFAVTFTTVATGGDIRVGSPDGVTAANLAICDFQLFAGSADLNVNALTQAPTSVQNGDWVVGASQYDASSSVSGAAAVHGSYGLGQFSSLQSTGAFTVLYVVNRVADVTGSGSDVIVSKPSVNGAVGWHDFAVGPDTQFQVGSFVGNKALDATPNGIFQAAQSRLWAPLGLGPAVYAHRFTGAQASAFVAGCKVLDFAVTTTLTTFKDLFFGLINGSFSGCNIYAVAVYPRALSDAEVVQATNFLANKIPVVVSRTIVFDGTSITVAVGGDSYAWTFPANSNPPISGGANYSIGGSSLGSLISRQPGILAAFAGAPPQTKIVSVECGANDFRIGFDYSGNPTGFLTALAAYLDTYRAAGIKVVMQTVLPCTSDTDGGVSFNNDRNAVNPVIRTWVGLHCDAVSDWAADPTMGTNLAPNNTTFYTGQIHPTTAGYQILEPITRAAINSIP